MKTDPRLLEMYRDTQMLKGVMEQAANAVGVLLEHGVKEGYFKRPHLHIVFMSPIVLPYATESREQALQRALLYEMSFGDKDKWEHPYDKIARDKAYMSWLHEMDFREIIRRHMAGEERYLSAGSTVWPGAVYQHKLAVGVSAQLPSKDELLARVGAGWVSTELFSRIDDLNAESLLESKDDCFIRPAARPRIGGTG
jgi:hypothetical protein